LLNPVISFSRLSEVWEEKGEGGGGGISTPYDPVFKVFKKKLFEKKKKKKFFNKIRMMLMSGK